jgi:predicted PP-loop superfamily ATPase
MNNGDGKICVRCVLPGTFPGIVFGRDGLCNHCRQAGGDADLRSERAKYERKFRELLGKGPGSAYDILVAYSGGKDSTYTLCLLKNKYQARVLAVSVDNGFVSGTALANIRTVTDRLGIDHLFFKPRWDLLKKTFIAASERELYAPKTLERASTICTSCMAIVKAFCLKTAIEQGIPMIGYGWSPGQAPMQSAIMKNNPAFVRMTQDAVLGPLREAAGNDVAAYFLEERHYTDPGRFPYNVHPLAWEHYNENMIVEEIGKYGWTAPADTDSNSTNCLLNAFANAVHIRRYGFHPYVWEIANMVRQGVMTREEGIRKIYDEQPDCLADRARERLGLPPGSRGE